MRRVIKKLKVQGSAHSYEIWVGQDLHLSFQGLPTPWKARKMYFVADSRLRSLAQTWVQALKKQGHSVELLTVHASEALKAFDAITPIYSWLLKKGADRSSLLWVMGGGTLGDALGFVAGTYLRGIDWVSVPTTLLAQVDSGVGGKTALNHSMGKNLIGVFHQPVVVLCDTQVLHRLPQREVYSGLGEVIKYALIFDARFFQYLKKNWDRILRRDDAVLKRVIFQCLQWKSFKVQQDERDLSGERALLNFGHTLGHVVEKLGGYSQFRHGEAVIWGMKAATALSVRSQLLSEKEGQEILQFLNRVPVPPLPVSFSQSEALQIMRLDKKAVNGQVRFVLLKALGQGVSGQIVSQKQVQEVWRWLKKQ